jgi:hypothetical protein
VDESSETERIEMNPDGSAVLCVVTAKDSSVVSIGPTRTFLRISASQILTNDALSDSV